VRTLEKIVAVTVLVGGATFAGYAYVEMAAENERSQAREAQARAAGFDDYLNFSTAKAAGISDPAAWVQRKKEDVARAAAERARVAGEKEKLLAEAREIKRDPADRVEVSSMSWKKGGFGSVALVTLSISNKNEYSVRDIAVTCTFSGSSGTMLSKPTNTIYDIIKPKSSRTFPDFNIGFIHGQAQKGNCSVESARRL
jgi:hypothetical protein